MTSEARTLDRMRLALLDEEFEVSVNALLVAEVPVLVMKGMDLGRRIYPSRLERPMTDVDLLVPHDAMAHAMDVLARAGFKKIGPYPRGRIRVELARGADHPTVELHRKLLAGDSAEWLQGIWRRAESVRIAGVQGSVRVLSAEDQVVYLIRHAGGQHLLESPVWLRDIRLMIEASPRLDWLAVVTELRRFRSCAATYLILRLLREEAELKVPDEALAVITRAISPGRRRAIERVGHVQVWFDNEKISYYRVMKRRFLLKDSWREGFVYALRAAKDHRQDLLSVRRH